MSSTATKSAVIDTAPDLIRAVLLDQGDGTCTVDIELLIDVNFQPPEFMINTMTTKGAKDFLKGLAEKAAA